MNSQYAVDPSPNTATLSPPSDGAARARASVQKSLEVVGHSPWPAVATRNTCVVEGSAAAAALSSPSAPRASRRGGATLAPFPARSAA